RPGLHHASSNECFFHKLPALLKRMSVGAFLSNSCRPTQFWIDLRIPCKRLHNFLWIIFVHDIDRLLFAGSIGISKLRLRRRETQSCRRARTKRRASQNGEYKGEKFWHKERDLSSMSGKPATDFFGKRKIFNLTSVECPSAPHSARLQSGAKPSGAYSD